MVIGVLLLGFILPGLSLTFAIFPGNNIGNFERLAFTLGLSLTIIAIGGIVLNWTPWKLNQTTWISFFGITILVASFVGVMRSNRSTFFSPWKIGGSIGLRQVIILSFAVLITLIAFGVSRDSATQQQSPGFTQLWILPGENDTIHVGIDSKETMIERFTLIVELNGKEIINLSNIELKPNESWETSMGSLTSISRLTEYNIKAELFKMGNPEKVYRWVEFKDIL